MSRKIDLSLFRGDDSDEEADIVPVKTKPVELNPLKSKTFAHGVTKKTKKDIEREEEERKKAEEEAATRRALEEFSRSFDGPSTGPLAHGLPRGRDAGRRSFVRAGEAPAPPPARSHFPDIPTTVPAACPLDNVRLPSPPPPPKPRGKRAMDAFLEEIKSNQEARDARLGKVAQTQGTSVTALAAFDSGRHASHETTNLCVSNLPPDVSESQLGQLFAQMGPVATVKIMWPRADFSNHASERFRPGITGFVAYMSRKDAANALPRFEGYSLNGNRLRVAWSKPVSLPRQPAYRPALAQGGRPDFASRSRDRSRSRSPPPRASLTSDETESARDYWLEHVDTDELKFIQEVSQRIRDHGPGLLETLKERERANSKFAFMFDQKTPEYHAFQYMLDRRYVFPDPPPRSFTEDGYASAYSSDSDERAEVAASSKVAIGKLAQRRLEAMLRSMSGKRVEIARAMEFAVKRADVADQITEIICLSLCVEDTPIPRKVARLHLVSDILHNSSSPLPNVWRYRQSFERRLPAIFEHFATIHGRLLEFSGTLSANVFMQQVDAVLDIWERWMVLTADTQSQLRKLAHGECTLASLAQQEAPSEPEPDAEPQFKSAGFKSSFKRIDPSAPVDAPPQAPPAPLDPTTAQDLDGEPVDDVDGEALDGEDVDGEAMDGEPLDGEPLDGEPLDGEAMDVDGDPMDGDLDGEPLSTDQ